MSQHFEKFAALRAKYPEEVQRIEQDEARLAKLLRDQEYAAEPVTQELLALCRKDILEMQKLLATSRQLTDQSRVDAWHIIDARLWFVKMVARDYEGELAQLDGELEAELGR